MFMVHDFFYYKKAEFLACVKCDEAGVHIRRPLNYKRKNRNAINSIAVTHCHLTVWVRS